jgi:hypothetical protein
MLASLALALITLNNKSIETVDSYSLNASNNTIGQELKVVGKTQTRFVQSTAFV